MENPAVNLIPDPSARRMPRLAMALALAAGLASGSLALGRQGPEEQRKKAEEGERIGGRRGAGGAGKKGGGGARDRGQGVPREGGVAQAAAAREARPCCGEGGGRRS